MPDVTFAIPGQASLSRKREKLAREAENDFPDLPNWMFWDKTQMDTFIDTNVNSLAEARIVLKALGNFVRIMIRLQKRYEERV